MIAIYVSLFLSFNVFALNMVFQFLEIGRWRDYLYGERAYMFLSLFAKTLLAGRSGRDAATPDRVSRPSPRSRYRSRSQGWTTASYGSCSTRAALR